MFSVSFCTSFCTKHNTCVFIVQISWHIGLGYKIFQYYQILEFLAHSREKRELDTNQSLNF